MFGFLLYWFTLIRLKWIVSCRKLASRFDRYSPTGADLSDEQATGLLASDSDWLNGCPNLERNENINLIGSNTVDKTSLRLSLKWRPHTISEQQPEQLQVASLLTKLSLELDGHGYDYDSVQTYRPSASSLRPNSITQYGSAGSSLKLFVLDPYRRYRLIYRGQMRRRDQPSELKFVKLNCLIFVTSKVYDFQQQFSPASLARQHVEKATRKLDIREALDQFVLLDRHEHSVRFVGELMLKESAAAAARSERKTIHLWGFHSRQFVVGERDQKLRSKRVLAHFTNGRLFHVAACEGIDHLADADMRFTTGYGCFRLGPAVASLDWLGAGQSIDWTKISSGTRELNFRVSTQERAFKIEASKREHPSEFHDFKMTPASSAVASTTKTSTKPVDGWGFVLINDGFDTNEELFRLERSQRDFRLALESGDCVHPRLFEAREFPNKPLIVDLDEKDCQYASLVGAKAASLAQLRTFCAAAAASGDASQPNQQRPPPMVPDAIVLTKFVYEAIRASNRQLSDSIRSLEARAGRGDLDGFERDCERLQELVRREIKLPGELKAELERRLKRSFGLHEARASLEGKSFAVRSSSWGEDEDDMSAAGQLTTVLNVASYERLLEALLECYASKFGHTNIEYKRQRGLPLDLPMAVVVQEMVACDKAGVLFTCDPALGDQSSLIITANYGLGESVVSAQTDPDTIRVVRTNLAADADEGAAAPAAPGTFASELKIADIKVGSKQVVMRGTGTGGDENANELAELDRSKCCLEEREIIELAGRSLELVRYFGNCQRDLEWAIKANRLYLLQSRPITGLDSMIDFELMHEGDSQSRAELEFVTRANVGEVMPYAMTPLHLSYSIRFWPIISGKIFEQILNKRPEDYMLDFTPDLVTDCYHAFFCLRSKVFVNFAGKPEDRPLTARAMEIGLFGHEVNDPELSEKATEMDDDDTGGNRFADLRFDFYTWRNRYMPFKLNRNTKKRNAQIRRDINSLRFAGSRNQAADNQMAGLLEQLRVLPALGVDAFGTHLVGTLISSKVNFQLLQFLAKYCKEPAQLYLAFSKILASSPDVLSAEIPRRIERMAKLIAKSYPAAEVESFANKCTPGEGLKFVTKDLKGDLAQEFDQFMVKFGHRCYNEFEISAGAWRDQPEKIIESLQSNVKGLLGKEAAEIVLEEEPKKSMDETIDSLGIPFSCLDRARLKYLLAPRCQMFVSVREQTKDNLIELVDIQRDATRLLARELRQNNRIPDEELLYFVFYRELAALVREPQPSLVIQAARRRKVFRMMFQQAWRYDEIIRGHRLLPMHLAETGELDEKLARASKLYGTTASSGKARGRVCIVNGYAELNKIEPGDILVTYSTDIAFSPIFPLISGVVTEIGGLISHGAVVAREYGLPSVIGIENATKILEHGEEILLDADNGLLVRLGMPADDDSAPATTTTTTTAAGSSSSS